MKKTVILSIIFLLLFSISTLYGQGKYTIKGNVADSISKAKLFYASVGIVTKDSNAKAIGNCVTDQNGNFELSQIPSGEYYLKASYIGYDMLTMPLSVKGNSSTLDMGNLLMNRQATMLEGVTITEKKPVYAVDGEKTLYNVAEDPGIQTGTAADALQNAPGVEVDIEGNITLRGVSSVAIWINDKPSNLEAENLKTYIQQLPANSLERIEVITNPSAKYSAKGTGGIINIVTNSNIKKNSFYSFGIRGSSEPNISPWFSYVWANEKWSISVYFHTGLSFSKSKSNGYSYTLTEEKDTSNYNTFESINNEKSYSGGIYFSGSYEIDSMKSISFWCGTYGGLGKSLSYSNQSRNEYLYNEGFYQYMTNQFSNNGYYGGYMGAWYDHKFNEEGHNISANIGFSSWNYYSDGFYYRNYQITNNLDKIKDTKNLYNNYYIDGGLDYTIPYIKNGEIGLGFNGEFGPSKSLEQNDTLIDFIDFEYITDSLRYKNGKEREGNLDFYATIQHKFGDFTVKAGLRTEYEHYDYFILNSPADNVDKGYWGFFPSLHLSYKTKSMHNFRLSYTRRVSNPEASSLSTFYDYSEDGYSMGNPDLRCTFSNSIEAGWTKFFQKFGSIGLSAYYRNSKDEINTMTDVAFSDIFGRMVSYSFPVNSGKSYRTGGDFNLTYRLKSFMSIRFYSNIYYSHSETSFRETDFVETNNLSYSFRLNFWAKAWKFLEINASANYRSKSKSIFMETRPTYSIDCGLRADFFKRKLSVHINVSDIFNWNKQTFNTTNPYYISYNSTKYNSRHISAGITLRFGKIELESRANSSNNGMIQKQGYN